MSKRKECVAMLLAGGAGSRLFALTDKNAKPAVPFGGKYRIIDFALSNCVRSGIDTVGVLTQYRPQLLHEYIGAGQPWDLDRICGGVRILPPFSCRAGADWYSGTANAIYQNLDFIEQYDAEYVLILSGDHIYRMDYGKMLERHKQSGAACTIAAIRVPMREASRFGIMTLGEGGEILRFAEKPREPESDIASMGVYVFGREKLTEYLIADAAARRSAHDFGKNIIPAMLRAGEKMAAFLFDGYWRDVGTVRSLWECHMDLLGEDPALLLPRGNDRVLSRSENAAPHYIGKGAVVKNVALTDGCEIYGKVEESVLGTGVTVGAGATVRYSVLMGNNTVGADARVLFTVADAGAEIGEDAAVGDESGEITVLCEGARVEIGESFAEKGGEQ